MSNQYKQLTLRERYQIEAFSKLEFSARCIASNLGRSNKTITNELARCPTHQYCERVSKLLLTRQVKTKSKKDVTAAIKKMLRPFKGLCKTITFDNGGEFVGHQAVKKHLGFDIYFAKPYHSWQRGLNENTNGLLRRYFPKGMAIGSLPDKEIKQTEFLINVRPRKALNYLSPYEYLTGKRVSLMAVI